MFFPLPGGEKSKNDFPFFLEERKEKNGILPLLIGEGRGEVAEP